MKELSVCLSVRSEFGFPDMIGEISYLKSKDLFFCRYILMAR